MRKNFPYLILIFVREWLFTVAKQLPTYLSLPMRKLAVSFMKCCQMGWHCGIVVVCLICGLFPVFVCCTLWTTVQMVGSYLGVWTVVMVCGCVTL